MNRRTLLQALLATASLPWLPWRAFKPEPDCVVPHPTGFVVGPTGETEQHNEIVFMRDIDLIVMERDGQWSVIE